MRYRCIAYSSWIILYAIPAIVLQVKVFWRKCTIKVIPFWLISDCVSSYFSLFSQVVKRETKAPVSWTHGTPRNFSASAILTMSSRSSTGRYMVSFRALGQSLAEICDTNVTWATLGHCVVTLIWSQAHHSYPSFMCMLLFACFFVFGAIAVTGCYKVLIWFMFDPKKIIIVFYF